MKDAGGHDQGGWERYLEPGERVLWQGQPVGGIIWSRRDIPVSLFGLVFLSFAIFWMAMASSTGAPYAFRFFGLPFAAIGAFMLFGRYLWDAYKRQHSWYTLTDRRGLIATEIFGKRSLKTIKIEPGAQIELVPVDGLDALWFSEAWVETPITEDKHGRRRGGHRVKRKQGFEKLADGREAFKIARALSDDKNAGGLV